MAYGVEEYRLADEKGGLPAEKGEIQQIRALEDLFPDLVSAMMISGKAAYQEDVLGHGSRDGLDRVTVL